MQPESWGCRSQPFTGGHRAAKDLKKLLGLTFFEPVRPGVALPPAAEDFAHFIRLAIAEIRQGSFEVSAFLGQDSTRIVVGAKPLSRAAIQPAASDQLVGGAEVKTQIQSVDGAYSTLLRDLRFGETDFLIGALRDPAHAEDVVQEVLFDDALLVVAAQDHPLANSGSVKLNDTLLHPWIAPPKATPWGSYLHEIPGIQQLPNSSVR